MTSGSDFVGEARYRPQMERGRYRSRTGGELTERQREVLSMLAAGKTNREIGDALGMTLDGAKFHVSELLTKLEVSSREEAAEWWRRERAWASRVRSFLPAVSLKWAALTGGAAVGLAAGALFLSGSSSTTGPSGEADDGRYVAAIRDDGVLRLAGSGWHGAKSAAELLDRSELVVLGRLTSVSEGRRASAPSALIAVYSVGTFVVDEVLQAPAGFASSDVPLYIPGGTVDGVSMMVFDVGPELRTGDAAILFLSRHQGAFSEPGVWYSDHDVKVFAENGERDRPGGLVPLGEALEAVREAAR